VPILWRELREYNPDFVAIDTSGNHWLIEVKMDKEMSSEDVQGKRHAALRWANYVNEADQVGLR
jgi:type III restriction enzyme